MYHEDVQVSGALITHKHLIVDHTQMDADSIHRCVETAIINAKQSGPIYVPDQFACLITKAKKKNGAPYHLRELTREDLQSEAMKLENCYSGRV